MLSTSNTWFPLTYALLSLPEASAPLGQLIETYWETWREAESAAEVATYRKLSKLKQIFSGYSDAEIWQSIERQNSGSAEAIKPGDLKLSEWTVLSNPHAAPRTDDFQITLASVPQEYDNTIEQEVLIECLREVQALTGFTRIESLSDYAEEEKLPQDHIMPMANKGPFWIPAAEVRGEGIFIQFREQTMQDWLRRNDMQNHNTRFFDAQRRWRQARRLDDPEANYPELRYVLLHTFAHALMRQLSLECGSAAASIRERIYAQSPNREGGAMAEILLYTEASDSEGTQGIAEKAEQGASWHVILCVESKAHKRKRQGKSLVIQLPLFDIS